MKKLNKIIIVLLFIFTATQAFGEGSYPAASNANATSTNQINSSQNQIVSSQGIGEGGNATSNSDSVAISGDSGAIANISTNSTSNYETRTPPVSMFPPYLPTFSHGGWGTIQAYFPNGPNGNDQMYECTFYPDNKQDMKELKGVMNALPYDGPLSLVGGILNCVGKIFGGPDNFHHGKGFDISNSIVRKRRPNNRPLYILIDSNINRQYLNRTGYTYVGKVSLEGNVERNWDLVYKAAIAEAVPWDVDLMLVSGGMKGVTVGTNTTFPGIAGAYSQTNYSVSMLGGRATGITEGKGVAMVSAECYRYNPYAAQRRNIPEAFYDRIHAQETTPQTIETSQNVEVSQKINPAVAEPVRKVRVQPQIETKTNTESLPQAEQRQTVKNIQMPTPTPKVQQPYMGVPVSQELYELAGFGQP